MIYSKQTDNDNEGQTILYSLLNIKPLSDFDPKEDDSPSFYYDRHDLAIRRIEFNNFLDFSQWKEFKSNLKSRIIINFSDDYLNILDLKRIGRVIKIKALDTSRITFVVMDSVFEKFTNDEFKKSGIKNVNVVPYPYLLKNVAAPPNYYGQTSYKFSSLSRNYHPWRLELYLRLLKEDLLKDFNFSFHNLKPYSADQPPSIGEMKANMSSRKYPITPKSSQFLEGIPYDIGEPDVKWSDVTYDAIYKADFHLLIESHYDCYLDGIWSYAKEDYNEEEFAPAFATEKTYKAINCKRPFIAVSTPYFLRGVNEMGFKTFSPYIDESYDEIVDNKERMKAIVAETKRICTLPQDEYETLINNLKPIVKHNFDLFVKLHQNDEVRLNDEVLNNLLPLQNPSMSLPSLNPEIY